MKNLPAKQETWIQSLRQEDPLDWKQKLTPVFLPGKLHGQRSLVGHSPWGYRESDKTEQLSKHTHIFQDPLANPSCQLPKHQCSSTGSVMTNLSNFSIFKFMLLGSYEGINSNDKSDPLGCPLSHARLFAVLSYSVVIIQGFKVSASPSISILFLLLSGGDLIISLKA